MERVSKFTVRKKRRITSRHWRECLVMVMVMVIVYMRVDFDDIEKNNGQ